MVYDGGVRVEEHRSGGAEESSDDDVDRRSRASKASKASKRSKTSKTDRKKRRLTSDKIPGQFTTFGSLPDNYLIEFMAAMQETMCNESALNELSTKEVKRLFWVFFRKNPARKLDS